MHGGGEVHCPEVGGIVWQGGHQVAIPWIIGMEASAALDNS
jgi:hypothetical protein